MTCVIWNLTSVHLEIVLVSVQDRCTVCMKRTICLKINLDTPDRTPRWCVSSDISLWSIWRNVSFGARLVHGLCLIYHTLRNHFGRNRWYSPLKRLKWKLGLVYLEIVLILMQDSCIVCMERNLCSEINLDASDRTSRWCVSYVILFWSIWRKC